MQYRIKRAVILLEAGGGSARGTEVLDFGFPVDEFLVGIQSFRMEYAPGTDHHVKKAKLQLQADLIGNHDEVRINAYAEMHDSSKNFIDNGSVHVCVIGIKNDGGEKAAEITALQSFEMEYGGGDHHVREVKVSEKETFIKDSSGHKSAGRASYASIKIPTQVAQKIKADKHCFLKEFYMCMGSDDHHIKIMSISSESGINTYVLEDKHGNRINAKACKLVNGVNCPEQKK